jgi:hypothetical protein
MRKKWLVAGLLVFSCGCQGMSNTEAGAVGGGIFGGILGTGIGILAHNPAAGMAIGAASGIAGGALVGAAEDRREAKADARAVATAYQNALPLDTIARMSQDKISDSVIIQQIRATNSYYNLTVDQIGWLHQMGVSDYVIMEMQSRRPMVVRPGPGYYYAPPPPPVAVGVGVGFVGH